jgi:DNA integrity scanning protein DisA with diadenylate cyclase activity
MNQLLAARSACRLDIAQPARTILVISSRNRREVTLWADECSIMIEDTSSLTIRMYQKMITLINVINHDSAER